MFDYNLKKLTIAAISSGLRSMMPLASYAKNEKPGLVEIPANADAPGTREETLIAKITIKLIS
jgi:hypothetical protein|tara:strand:- start:995 stop:1183 length:189 start_codon:yes stop_codon:yes gene_type:complete